MLDVVFNWRYSSQDGLYGPSGSLNLPSSGSTEKYIGTAYLSSISWQFNELLDFNVGVQYFKTGPFINDIIPHHQDGFFVGSVVKLKF